MFKKCILGSLLLAVSLFGQSRETDSLALVTIYNEMDGGNWSNASSWLSGSDISTWEGVTVSGGRVTQLDVYNKNLSGKIPAAVGDLSELTYLRFGSDAITDSIPAAIGNLSKLQTLYVYYSEITSVPNTIGRLSALENLYLYNNNITAIPDSIGSLSQLRYLYMYNNDITSIPDSIGNLSSLQYLFLHNNEISSIPSTIGNLASLRGLRLENNRFATLPSELYSLTNLTDLYLGSSFLTTLSSDIGNLTNLSLLHLSNSTNLSSLPSEIASLTNLTQLYMEYMNLNSVPEEIFSLTNLQYLYLYNNNLSSLSSSLSSLTALRTLSLGYNKFTSIPTELYGLTNLENLYLNNNQLADTIPNQLMNLTSLRNLYLYNNDLTGEIPANIGDLSNLYQLNLSVNELSGEIPESITNLVDLRYLYLQDNHLSGALPDSMEKMIDLDYVYLYNNELETIPADLGNHDGIIYLYLYNNNFTSLPNFTGTDLDNTISLLHIYGNNLGFADIIPNIGVASSGYDYTPMNAYGTAIDTIMSLGQSITLSVEHDHVDNVYQWYKNGVLLMGETNQSLSFASLIQDDAASYTYTVTNSNASDLTLTSAEQKILIPDSQAPASPANFSIAPRDASAILTWSANSEADFSSYRIYGGLSSAKTSSLIDSTTEHTYTLTSLTNDSEYEYYITAVDLWGNESAASATLKVTPDGTAPLSPTGLSATAGEEAVELTWDANSENDINFYSIYYGTSPNPTTLYTTTSSTSRTVSGLTNDQQYYFRISATDNATNISDTTADVTATPSDMAPPAPIDFMVTENNQKITAEWDIEKTIPDFYAYKLYMDTLPNPTKLVDSLLTQYSAGSSSLKIDVEGLENNKNYYLRLKTFDLGGLASDYSNEVLAEPDNYRVLDSLALVAFYNAMDGSNWTSADTWLTSSDISTWEGVTVSNDRVSQLNLYNKNLSGRLPAVLGDLTELTYLYMGNDDITDSIPKEIGKLTKLQTLQIRNTQIKYIPEEIGQLSELIYFYLYYNDIVAIPNTLSNLDKVTYFYVYGNELTELPASIGDMESLFYLQAHTNKLTSLPENLFNAQTLQYLYVQSNNINSIPALIENLNQLQVLNLSFNPIASFPEELGNMTSLAQVYLESMELTEVPSFIFNLSNLNTLSLSGNKLAGNIPASLLNLTGLTNLYLANNMLTGSIPSTIGNLTNLNTLYLYGNDLTGSIPSEFGNISGLYNLRLQDNKLTGSIPSSFGNLTNLYYLYLYSNELSGEIPSEITSMTNLRYFYVNNNKLTGTLPSGMETMTNLDYVQVNDNMMSGTIPADIGNHNGIRNLYIYNNYFDSLPNFTGTNLDNSLNYFYIYGNKFGFEDIVPNINVANNNFNYSSMKTYGTAVDTIVSEGNSLSLKVLHGHADNAYQWYKDGASLTGETAQILTIDTLSSDDIASYTYTVTNSNANSLTLTSEPINVLIPDSTAPTAPNNFSSSPRDAAAYLTWTANSEIDFSIYRIYGGLVGSKTTSLLDSTTENSYTATGLTNGAEYEFYVLAVDLWGNESLASENKKVTPDGSAPAIPSGLTASPRENAIFLDWTKNAEADFLQYYVYQGSSASNLVLIDSTAVDSIVVDNLINGTEYFFAVSAIDKALNKSDTSSAVSEIPVNQTPPVVEGLSLIETNEKITLRWTNSLIQDFNYYKIYMGSSANPTTAVDSIYSIGTTSYEFSNLTNGTEYFFRMTQVDDDHVQSAFSSEVSGTPNNYFSQDSLALVAVYDSLGGANWSNNSNWLESSDLNDWYGVTVSDGRVTNLTLNNNNLIGRIPDEIGDLTALSQLQLRSNSGITGSIPTSIGNLSNLEYLYLYSTSLSGSIPNEIGNLSKLYYLYLYSNDLTGSIPSSIGNLTRLDRLYLHNNDLSGSIPPELGNLDNLRYLYLQSNDLTGEIPKELGNISALYYLQLTSNQLTGSLPSELGSASNLTYIYIQDNQLSGQLPVELSNLSNLYRFYANDNQFSGRIPIEYGNLANLDRFYIYNNNIDSLPDFTGTAIDNEIRYFYVYGNQLDFGDIVPNLNIATSNFNYSSQDSIGTYISDFIDEGGNYSLTITTPGDSNHYQWYKDNSAITGATSSSYMLTNFAEADEAVYSVRVTNSLATNLTLYSRTSTLRLREKPEITSSLLQNPASTKYTDIVVVSDMELLSGSKVVMTDSAGSNDINLTRIAGSTVYKGSYVFANEGSHTMTTTAKGASGLDSIQVRSLNVSLAKVGKATTIASLDGAAILNFRKSDLKKNRFVRAESHKNSFVFGPVLKVDQESEVSIKFKAEEIDEVEKLFVYQKSGSEWIRLKSRVYLSQRRVSANVKSLGEFIIKVDPNYDGSNLIPDRYELKQNYPNPFNPVTRIPFSLKENTKVTLHIFNILGQRVKTLVNKSYEAGNHVLLWKGKNDLGRQVASGMYFYQLITPKFVKTKKMLLIK